MIRNYLKVAWRNLERNKFFSVIHVLGLSVGLACCVLILLYTKDELSFDRFHENRDRLFRVTCEVVDKKGGRDRLFGEAGAVQGPAFKTGVPEIKDFVRTYEQNFLVETAGTVFEEKGTWADADFFTFFSFPLLSGNPTAVLSDPHSVVLSEDLAVKYFGAGDIVGKTLEVKIDQHFESFVVSGVAKRCPENSSIKFDMLLPFSYYAAKSQDDHGYWHLLNYSTYLLLRPGAKPAAVAAKMQEVYTRSAGDQIAGMSKEGTDRKFIWGLQPFLRMHLDADVVNEGSIRDESNPIYSYILTGIAIFILLIACINFINLTVAQSFRRSKEIGLRKVIGSSRERLMRQFLGESVLLCAISFVLAVVLAAMVLPLFNELANKRLSLAYLLDGPLISAFIGLFLLTSLAAGFYPAIVLSKFKPVETLHNRVEVTGKNYLSKGLVVVQFALTTFLIIGTLVIHFQYNYLTRTQLGYNEKNLLVVSVSGQQAADGALLRGFATGVASIPGVQAVGQRMNGRSGTTAKAGGREIPIDFERIDESYLQTMQIPLVKGRNFSRDFAADSTQSVVVNETFVQEAGWADPIGKTVDQIDTRHRRMTVVGVVKDYHYASLKQKIGAQVFTLDPSVKLGQFLIRVDAARVTPTLAAIENMYKSLDPKESFNYHFVSETNRLNYASEDRWRQIIGYAAMLTVIISGLGLFGLTLLSIRKRTKEIGVRKVLGAGVWQISALVARSFMGLVLISFVIAVPTTWYVASRWLENFPYRIALNGWIFMLGAGLTLIIAVLTVSVQSVRAARMSPVKSLKVE